MDFLNEEIYDVIGIGFGPAGIALSVAMKDFEEGNPSDYLNLKCLFVEQAKDSTWMPEMLLPGTDIQHHYLRDLATPRNPRSRYTFPMYLKEKDRLFTFGQFSSNPGRIEWSDYVKWVADQVSENTLYRHKFLNVEPIVSSETKAVEMVQVSTQDLNTGAIKKFKARNIVLSTGRRKNIPEICKEFVGPRVFHSSGYKSHIKTVREKQPTFAVIGSGQNAIEIVLDLAHRFPQSKINSIHRGMGFRLYDLGHFSNEVYFPYFADYFYSVPKQKKQHLFEKIKHTNYSAVDADVSRSLYWKIYEEGIQGINRIQVINNSELTTIAEKDKSFKLNVTDMYTQEKLQLDVDYIILCTGFYEEKFPNGLQPLSNYIELDEDEDLIISQNYEVKTSEKFTPKIYVNGLTERTHGISDAASFSMMAVKAGKIQESIQSQLKNTRILQEVE
ncbi:MULTISPECIES: SidA/IucD/PvdA family monooxygenase [Bacillus cereus group]|uniref:L-lysine N6-monooxygenase MbtG n=1 Tax=Bacillus cereus TaxID=1396 RepID=A0A9X8IZH3_BACCE|nr:SidA/IucD/PvdA family monooxygenase [Bacillus cereus]RWQ73554.1 hypothetical protein DR116_0016050 [Bacillus cereus]